MKYLKLFFLLFVWSLILPSCDNSLPDSGDTDEGKTDENEFVDSDTIDYRALVFVEEGDLQSYGGERAFKNNLEKMFYNTTRFWNESPNKFKYYFRWVPAGVQTYKIDGERNKSSYDKQRSVTDNLDYSKYDFAVFFALGVKSGEGGLSCGGSSKVHKVVWAYIEEGHNIFTDAEYPNQGTYSNLGHEYGHVRGAQDLYQYMISADKNTISHEAYPYPECNMGTGYMVWSDYCSSLFNYDALMKQLPDRFDEEVFPEQVVIRVMQNGEPVNRATVRLWGTRAGGYFGGPEVYAKEPFLDNKVVILAVNISSINIFLDFFIALYIDTTLSILVELCNINTLSYFFVLSYISFTKFFSSRFFKLFLDKVVPSITNTSTLFISLITCSTSFPL